jgi:3-hydroxyisobutyrate dehydrogenase
MGKIAFLGLGMMGSGMAGCLVRAGHQVTVWNRSPDKAEALVAAGAIAADSPAEAANGAEAVFSMIADDPASDQCWFGPTGALGVLGSGAFVIECSTISHGQSRKLAESAAAKDLRYIDCPVNGPPAMAAKGELTLLVGAEPADLEAARPWLELVSSSILHFGPTGTGTAYKLINNLLGAVHVAATAEAAHLARKLGLDVDTTVAAIETGPVGSPHTKRMIRPMLEGRPADSFGLAIGLREKDARYCLAMARDLGLDMTVGEDAHGWYVAAKDMHGADDDSLMLNTIAKHDGKAPG